MKKLWIILAIFLITGVAFAGVDEIPGNDVKVTNFRNKGTDSFTGAISSGAVKLYGSTSENAVVQTSTAGLVTNNTDYFLKTLGVTYGYNATTNMLKRTLVDDNGLFGVYIGSNTDNYGYLNADIQIDLPLNKGVDSVSIAFSTTGDVNIVTDLPLNKGVDSVTVVVSTAVDVNVITDLPLNKGVDSATVVVSSMPEIVINGIASSTMTVVNENYMFKSSTHIAGTITNATGVTQTIGNNYFDFQVYNFSFVSLSGVVTSEIDGGGQLFHTNASYPINSPEEIEGEGQLDSPSFELDMTSGTTVWYEIWGVE